jgi:hypothetical protein
MILIPIALTNLQTMPKLSNNVNIVEMFTGKVQHRLFVDRYAAQ